MKFFSLLVVVLFLSACDGSDFKSADAGSSANVNANTSASTNTNVAASGGSFLRIDYPDGKLRNFTAAFSTIEETDGPYWDPTLGKSCSTSSIISSFSDPYALPGQILHVYFNVTTVGNPVGDRYLCDLERSVTQPIDPKPTITLVIYGKFYNNASVVWMKSTKSGCTGEINVQK